MTERLVRGIKWPNGVIIYWPRNIEANSYEKCKSESVGVEFWSSGRREDDAHIN